MGLIKATGNAIGSALGDQWREYFYCDSMAADVLVKGKSARAINVQAAIQGVRIILFPTALSLLSTTVYVC